mgnify:CR=1 FL=1
MTTDPRLTYYLEQIAALAAEAGAVQSFVLRKETQLGILDAAITLHLNGNFINLPGELQHNPTGRLTMVLQFQATDGGNKPIEKLR